MPGRSAENERVEEQQAGKDTRRRSIGWLARILGTADLTEPPIPERRASERRSHSLWSFTYGSFRPRRRAGRRDGDHERIFLDWHEPRVLYLSLAILLMCCADALFTLNLLAIGAEELNVLMDTLIAHDVRRFLALKIGVTGASVVLLGLAARRQFLGVVPVYRVLQLFCAGYVALILWELWLFGVYVTDLPFHWRPWSD
jgi:hypothetical protein